MMKRVAITSTRYQMCYRTFSPCLTWLGYKVTFYHMFERVTTHYQTLQTWIGHDATRYRNFNVLRDALPYIFPKFIMVWDYLQCITVKCMKKYIFKKNNNGNLW